MSTPVSTNPSSFKEPTLASSGFGDVPVAITERHAAPPRAPQMPPSLRKVEAAQAGVRRGREVAERQSMLRGLILLALVLLALSMLHAGAARVFPSGWWRQW